MVIAVAATITACSTRAVDLRPVDSVVLPQFAPSPDDPGESSQLAALVERDRSGLVPSDAADGGLLATALQTLAEQRPDATDFTRISVYVDSIHFGFVDPTNAYRSISASYRDSTLHVSEPVARTEETSFRLDGVDPAVPGLVADAIATRYPSLRVTTMDLRPGLSYDYGLLWNLDVRDAPGNRATVFVELDGTVVGVDQRD